MPNQEQIDVKGDGRIVLYKRPGLKRPAWQARLRVPGASGYKIVSTRHHSLREAQRFALELYEELYLHVREGGSIHSKTFREVFDEWVLFLHEMRCTQHGGSWEATTDRVRAYALRYFGDRKIETLGAGDFSDFLKWRRSNYSRKAPTAGTLGRERTCLMPLMKFALERGYIRQLPKIERPRSKFERRPTFTFDEWKAIEKLSHDWVEVGRQTAVGRNRYVAQHYFFILANTGMRVGEARGMKWRDLRTIETHDGSRMIAEVSGKTGIREVVFQPGSEKFVENLFDLRREEIGDHPPDDGFVFAHKSGEAIRSFKTAFNSLVRFCDIPFERHGRRRTVYSLRHYYATERLANETNPFLLAKQMGTSVDMLERYYGQTINSQVAAQISRLQGTMISRCPDQ